MSRSYKKVPIVKSGKRNNKMKRIANRSIRQKDLPNGSAYKKAFESYNISDWKFRFWGDLETAEWKDKRDYIRK